MNKRAISDAAKSSFILMLIIGLVLGDGLLIQTLFVNGHMIWFYVTVGFSLFVFLFSAFYANSLHR
ncbi:hypothetical protein ACDX77_18995 [Bacillus velezensis]|uniref:hypothetical protein n=1 Tax=Bacillus velezensis TaxID=492670 RepID=UPI003557CCF9